MKQAGRPEWAWAVLAAGACAAVLAGGCGLDVKPGAKGLFDVVKFEGPSPGELAAMAIDPYDANARYVGTMGLASAYFASQPAYLALFSDNIRDADPAVRTAAARGLANHGGPAHAGLLIAALGDESDLVRVEAARGLQRIHDPAAVDGLIVAAREADPLNPELAGEENADVRTEAAHALGQYAQTRVVLALIPALADPSLAVNRNALSSLRTLTGQDFGFDRHAWSDWFESVADPFAGRTMYVYPAFWRRKKLVEHLPLLPPPPNEVAGPPAGMPR